jgi:hypothetical protein
MQIVRSAGSLLILLFLIWSGSRAGFASLLYTYAARTNQLIAANAAVGLSPRDPEAHYIRGATLEASDDLPAATNEYAEAVSLRPVDYVLWLSLAHGRELSGDTSGASAAASEAVRLAPYYAQPHWQLGNLLVRAGRQNQGFAELRLAAAKNPSLLPSIIDLAWQLSHGSAEYVQQAIQPNTPEADRVLAEYFAKRGKVSEAIELIRAAGSAAEDYRRQYLNELISAKRFEDAYSLWLIAHPADPDGSITTNNSGFEQESDLDEPGFGWRAKKVPGVLLSLDSENPREGKSSLRIEFKGESEPGLPIITQLVNLQRHAHYQLHFSVRTEEIISGGLPGVTILDAESGQVLSQSGSFPLASNGWRDYVVDFTVPPTTPTIQIVLQRRCTSSPCPIYGRLWLDDFALQKK